MQHSDDNLGLFRGLGVEINLKSSEDFLKIKETLTRIGVASRKTNTLTQSCHILHKRGRYAILHFKELFIMDGKETTFSEEDAARRNTIASLLEEWGLVQIVTPVTTPKASMSNIKIIPFKDRDNWTLTSKYSVGGK
ncbi:translational repressor [Sinorhizobium phage phiM7]|uniref:Translation repressor protein n=3 Tax=Emdodecavirus TaxID=1980937 RepID=S5MUZ4_9CAUD|nr:regA gene product translational repressor [Sinorhizobium phage phiM12]YP_009212278.1 translational repressor [Sinorhizobium phage phiN3]YP_009601148.1 translational repressor [Sinorhizobium phage phiM7]AKF12931.1 translational repressor [Sinorhizobium phage phiM19]AGR47667.1 regA gene product translational repressor [Sinorhizobium phage phiM12]AKF12571.1 translational repressor [Sinorhizobium phage phiM7]AKF13303.1 translational repressor [Sinorhizobium phage phiN3]